MYDVNDYSARHLFTVAQAEEYAWAWDVCRTHNQRISKRVKEERIAEAEALDIEDIESFAQQEWEFYERSREA